MTTMSRPFDPTTPAGSAAPPVRRRMAALFAACRLEDGARWALLGAVFAIAVVILLAA